jgi:hypothetical protein
MFSFFKKKEKNTPKPVENVTLSAVKPLDYHPKIILAWARAIKGNDDLMRWLKENGWEIELNLGYYPYPNYEPMAFWGDCSKIKSIITN